MPDGIPLDTHKVEVRLIDANDPTKKPGTGVDQDGRFILSYKKGRSFTIFAYQDGIKDGKAVRFFGQSQKLTVKGTVGPITITLDRIARKE